MKKIIMIVLVLLFSGLTIATAIGNFFCNEEFFSASITQVLTLGITLSVAFWATQYKTDLRKMKEHAEEIIHKLQALVSHPNFYSIPFTGDEELIKKQINSTNRKINNCLSVLAEYGKTLKFEDEFKYIQSEFEVYKYRMGEHINDLEYLSKSENEFKRTAENIDSKCDYIILKLYK